MDHAITLVVLALMYTFYFKYEIQIAGMAPTWHATTYEYCWWRCPCGMPPVPKILLMLAPTPPLFFNKGAISVAPASQVSKAFFGKS